MILKRSSFLLYLAMAIIAIQSCAKHYFRSNYQDANRLLYESDSIKTKLFLKAHLKNGDICILRDSWAIDTISNVLTGLGTKYDFNRSVVADGEMSIPIDSVAIFETNKKINNPESARITALSILFGLEAALGFSCAANPKACFGSCPTFYVNENDDFHYADAEGFSNAILPSLEYFDIDALNNKALTQNSFSITMKNEALETHCVNEVKLLACPRKRGERVYQSRNNEFYRCENTYPLSKAQGNQGDVTALLKNEDRVEWFSYADAENLKSKEEIVLYFDEVEQPEQLGLILNFRQTLMTTYFIYSAMGYMGDEVGDIFAKMEQNKETKEKLEGGIQKELGDIDIYLWNEQKNQWELQSGLYETGPIAINRQFVPLAQLPRGSTVKLKLVLNKGLWRIDYVALTNITDKLRPIEISPSQVLKKGQMDNAALAEINNPQKHLISMPGSEYKFNFTLPSTDADYELFLYSKGYYLEWMREEWLRHKDLLKLRQMIYKPKQYLRDEASNYKQYETNMEEVFWNSKINTKTVSFYEN